MSGVVSPNGVGNVEEFKAVAPLSSEISLETGLLVNPEAQSVSVVNTPEEMPIVPEVQVAPPVPIEMVQPIQPSMPEVAPRMQAKSKETFSVPAPELYQPAQSTEVFPKSEMPAVQEQLHYTLEKDGEKALANPNIVPVVPRVTSQQLVSKIAGYYPLNQGLLAGDPTSGLIQQTATTGDPTQATTWQSALLLKVLQTFLRMLPN